MNCGQFYGHNQCGKKIKQQSGTSKQNKNFLNVCEKNRAQRVEFFFAYVTMMTKSNGLVCTRKKIYLFENCKRE